MTRPASLLATLPPPPPGRSGWPWTEEVSASCYAQREGWPRISIVTPSYNQAAYLEETIRSVLLQNYPNLQYIVIDGGSTDGSVEILKKYAPWLDSWVSEPDRGQSHAINKGLAHCDGEWFNWLNSDDYLLPQALASLGAADGSAHIVAGATRNLRDGHVFGTYTARVSPQPPATFFSLGVNQPGSLLRRETVQMLGGAREDLRLTMDLDLWLRILLRHGPSAFTATATEVACYRYHANSKTCSEDDVFALDEFALLFDLAAQSGVTAANALQELRGRSGIPPTRFPGEFLPASTAAERAWLDRLLVSDSLLFRALLRANGETEALGPIFLRYLDFLRPFLIRHYPTNANELEARALVHAQQALGRYDRVMTTRALRRHFRPAIVLDTLRLLAGRARRHRP